MGRALARAHTTCTNIVLPLSLRNQRQHNSVHVLVIEYVTCIFANLYARLVM